MSRKITLPGLVAMLAQEAGCTKKQAEDFIRELFSVISAQLEAGEQVKIRNIGVFKTIAVEGRKSVNVSTGEDTMIPPHRKVVFVPSKELAAAVNAPFEMFDTVELADGVDFETERETAPEPDPETISEPEAETAQEPETVVAEAPVVEAVALEPVEPEPVPEPEEEETEEEADEPEEDVAPEAEPEETEEAEELTESVEAEESDEPEETEEAEDHGKHRGHKHKFITGFLLGMACTVLLIAAFYAIYRSGYEVGSRNAVAQNADTASQTVPTEAVEEPADTIAPVEKDTVATSAQEAVEAKEEMAGKVAEDKTSLKDAAPTEPSDKKVYDTITKTRYLTTMAKEHYGNYHLWPYIYMENRAILGHPDRIKPGTKVVIPSLKKYGVNPHSAADIATAKRKGIEIYARYK